jgi:hypothetical protein
MSWFNPDKIYICDCCNKQVKNKDILSAPSPFDPEDTITGCPHCKIATGEGGWTEKCEREGCKKTATCGVPMPDGGYLRCCGDHYRALKE